MKQEKMQSNTGEIYGSVERRASSLLDVVPRGADEKLTIADLGCGSGELLTCIQKLELRNIQYIGADQVGANLGLARRKHPEATFLEVDICSPDADIAPLVADYVIVNGLLAARDQRARAELQASWTEIVAKVWRLARRGVALNLTAGPPHKDSDDGIQVPMQDAARVLHELAGRNIVIRVDDEPDKYIAYASKVGVNRPGEEYGASPSEKMETSREIPVLRPLIARRDRIMPYLERIDDNRVYSNFGPLFLELNGRLSDSFGLPSGSVIGASSGTAALMGAILAEAGPATPDRPLAIVPAFTFVATALAVEQCGYEVHLADIDEDTWMLSPESTRRRPDLNRVGLVVPVAPFGRSFPQEPWQDFHSATGIPVVVDAAACFEAFSRQDHGKFGKVPSVLSLHATKSFSTGEGGAVVSQEPECILRVARALNFGFLGDRDCRKPGFNGKMSEYHAAVGLAELDGWQSKSMACHQVLADYEREFAAMGLSDRLILAPDIASCYVLFYCRAEAEAVRLAVGLSQDGIGHRSWYGAGLQAHSHFQRCSRDELAVTKDLTTRLIGLPAGPTLSKRQIERVASAVGRYIAD